MGLYDIGMDVSSSDEVVCQSAIKSSLINPETVEFFEFKPVSKESYLSKIEQDAREVAQKELLSSNFGSGLSGNYALAAEMMANRIISEHVSEAVSHEKVRINRDGLRTFTYRVKAEGQLGNKITSVQYCSLNDTACTCV